MKEDLNETIIFPNVLFREINDPEVQKFVIKIYEIFGADLDGDVMNIAEMIKKLAEYGVHK